MKNIGELTERPDKIRHRRKNGKTQEERSQAEEEASRPVKAAIEQLLDLYEKNGKPTQGIILEVRHQETPR